MQLYTNKLARFSSFAFNQLRCDHRHEVQKRIDRTWTFGFVHRGVKSRVSGKRERDRAREVVKG